MTDPRDPVDRLTEIRKRLDAAMKARISKPHHLAMNTLYAYAPDDIAFLLDHVAALRSSHAGMLADMATVAQIIDAARAMPEPLVHSAWHPSCAYCRWGTGHAPDCPWLVLQSALSAGTIGEGR